MGAFASGALLQNFGLGKEIFSIGVELGGTRMFHEGAESGSRLDGV